jgi:hypothetical protein
MIGHHCKNCLWWDQAHPATATIPRELGKTSPGICRKHKPGSLRIGQHFYGVQPVTDADEFCGEFRQDQEQR